VGLEGADRSGTADEARTDATGGSEARSESPDPSGPGLALLGIVTWFTKYYVESGASLFAVRIARRSLPVVAPLGNAQVGRVCGGLLAPIAVVAGVSGTG